MNNNSNVSKEAKESDLQTKDETKKKKRKRHRNRKKKDKNKLSISKENQIDQANNGPCSPRCLYFPDMTCNDWKYDEEIPYLKRRSDNKKFICGWDGHEIKNWNDCHKGNKE